MLDSIYHMTLRAFSKCHHRHTGLTVEYNIWFKNLLQQGISEPVFNGDLAYKF